ncbi:ATPase associated with various cellular activities AAA_5 [Actinobacteria bacterium OV450]|nr:ATPase associated with various cellular activities AAA_5 [Actinobacteria bacterium OV450]
MAQEYPEFQLRLPHGGPTARGRLLSEMGTNGSQKMVVLAGSPARRDVVPSFPLRTPSSHRLREKLIAEGAIRESTTWPGWLEVTRDVECNSPSAAGDILVGRSCNGWLEWKTDDGRPLADFLEQVWSGPSRAWLVRGPHPAGLDLVQNVWLVEGRVTLVGLRLRPDVAQKVSKEQLRTFVDEDYESAATYNEKVQLVDELHAFFSRMRPGDTVCTVSDGRLYIGEITGSVEQRVAEDGSSNLRRPVEWGREGFLLEELPQELRQQLSLKHVVVDLTTSKAIIDGLGVSDEELVEEARDSEDASGVEPLAVMARREVELPEPTEELRKKLNVHRMDWLEEIRNLLADEKQLIFYGPPGTGKTFLAQELAEYFGGGREQVKLVQFHPSYAYEDFFEGFRPREDRLTREVAFRLTAGPLREFAELARREGNRHIPHFLIIDEINRANLAKVFGELYFLLEYRDRSVRLTYSGEDFFLPRNLFIIGTMNTADRSIALVDAAMRRRFAFVELSPRIEPTGGLLRRWLGDEKDSEPADLLDELNARIDDADFRIGPSYLMKPGVFRAGGLERTWRTKILPLLEEHHYGEGLDIESRYGLPALRQAVARRSGQGHAGEGPEPQ